MHSDKPIEVVVTLAVVNVPRDELRSGGIAGLYDLAAGNVCSNGMDITGAWHTEAVARIRKVCTATLEIVKVQ